MASQSLIQLAHYLGDIQPVHVGAAYFDEHGQIAGPDNDKSAFADEGGNTFTLELRDDPPRRRGFLKKNSTAFGIMTR